MEDTDTEYGKSELYPPEHKNSNVFLCFASLRVARLCFCSIPEQTKQTLAPDVAPDRFRATVVLLSHFRIGGRVAGGVAICTCTATYR